MKYAPTFLFSKTKALKGRCMKSASADFMKLKNQRGGSLVEFAVIAPLLFVILFGIVEFGLILYNKAVLTNGSREGARYGIVTSNSLSAVTTVVENYCNPRLRTFGTMTNVSVSTVPHTDLATPFNDNLEVLVNWNYSFLAFPNLPGVGLNNSINLSGRTVMKYE
jgi:Flp pilus assembly protein TadG